MVNPRSVVSKALLVAAVTVLVAIEEAPGQVPVPGAVIFGTVPEARTDVRGTITRAGKPLFEVPAELHTTGNQTFYVLRVPLESSTAPPGQVDVARAGDRLAAVVSNSVVIAQPDLALEAASVVRVDAALVPVIAVSPLALDFGEIEVATSTTMSVDVRNLGGANLRVSSLALSGPERASFRVVGGTGGFTLTPDASRRLDLAFEPTADGPQAADLEVRSNDAETPLVRVSLAGSGLFVGTRFRRGDADASGSENLTDVEVLLNYLFLSGPAPGCLATGDVDDDGEIDIGDPLALLFVLFEEATPTAPFGACGVDPTPEGLSCERYPPCP